MPFCIINITNYFQNWRRSDNIKSLDFRHIYRLKSLFLIVVLNVAEAFSFLSELESYVLKCTIGNLFFEELCLMHLLFHIFCICKKHPQSAHKFLFSIRTSIPPIVSQDNNHLVVWFSPTEMELSLLFVVKMQIHSENLGSAAFVGFRSTSSIHLPFGWRSDPK